MKTKKAFIRQDGEIDLKEIPAIELIDTSYEDKMKARMDEINSLLKKSNTDS